jgi:sirohydrochlorin ferrochelatase
MKKALLVVDHGSVRGESNVLLEQITAIIQNLRPQVIVHHAHMDLAEPSIEQGIARCVKDGATEIVVQPYMLARGRHATQDLPNMVKAAVDPYPHVSAHVTEPLGLHDKIIEVVLERAHV